jgi:hypothetical protein
MVGGEPSDILRTGPGRSATRERVTPQTSCWQTVGMISSPGRSISVYGNWRLSSQQARCFKRALYSRVENRTGTDS